ncbi:50S ribosome-binding GTPase [Candidatus Pacearchaeota archaeon]|nr:50S ribosome-binding GTPase [Candidatus Pacearchaeota archaeon]
MRRGFWTSAMKAIKDADIVLFVLDARMPELSRNRDLETKLEESNKEFLIVFNKIDLVSKEVLKKLKKENPNAFFVSSGKNININNLYLALQSKLEKSPHEKLEIGIVGYPNVGKSALTNVLSQSVKTQVSSRAGTTKGNQWAVSSQFKIIDSPGVIPFGDDEAKLGILGAKNPEKLKNPELVATEIIKIFLKLNPEKLEKFYEFKIQGNDEYEIMLQIGHAKNLLKKGGLVEENRTCVMIIRDWQTGRLKI